MSRAVLVVNVLGRLAGPAHRVAVEFEAIGVVNQAIENGIGKGRFVDDVVPGGDGHRFGASSETAEQLQLAIETSEIAAAAMTARMKLPDIEEKDKPKRRPIPDHIPRMEVELSPSADACADCGGRLRRIGEDVTEELEYVPGPLAIVLEPMADNGSTS